MPTITPRGGHNVPVTPHSRARGALVVFLLVSALLLSGCGGDGKAKPKAEPSADLPTGNVEVPEGITLTPAGTELRFGEPAAVAYEPNTQRSSVISLSVDSAQEGRIADFAAYQLDDRTKKSRPYYVRVTVKNVGTGDLSRAAIPLLAVSDKNTQYQPSSFNNSFARCPSLPLPAGFVGGQAFKGCLVYLIPDGGRLVEVNYRPLQAFEPITWRGTILPPVTKKPDKKKSAKKKANP
jgi:hypothetical protein